MGILIFIGLYFYASTLYPGGSQINAASIGYDWINNYWCDLYTLMEPPNPSRPFAILAMIILCLSFIIFFIQFAHVFSLSQIWKKLMIFCGSLSMLFATFIFSSYHDLMIVLSSILGIFPVIGIVLGIYKSDLTSFKVTGSFGLILLLINNVIYYSKSGIHFLPLIQKITFLVILFWIIALNFQIIKRKAS